MNYTNRHDIPAHICKWLELDSYDYDPNVISATTLIGPARAFVLKKQHADDLTMDYSDLLSARYGTAIHDSLEKAGVFGEGDFKEKRFYCEVLGVTISGKVDAVISGVIRDNKSTSVWKFVKQEFDDYIKQLSIYKYILHRNGIETESFGMIDFFFTDWKKSDAEKGGDYPPIRYQEQRLELMTLEETEAFIQERITEFLFAESSLPECTKEELWTRDEAWAVYAKAGQARAKKICKSEAEAQDYTAANGGVIEHRPGKVMRCNYCTAAPFCDQYRKLKEAGLIDA